MSDVAVELEVFEPPAESIGEQIDAIQHIRDQIDGLEEEIKELKKILDVKLYILLKVLDKEQTPTAAGKLARASVEESVVPQVEDWEKYWAFIRRHNAFELLQKRPAEAAWREHAARRREGTVPGTVPYVKRRVKISKK